MSEKDVILDKSNENERVVLENKSNQEIEKEKVTKDLSLFFDNIISKGQMTKQIEVTEGLTVELKVLDTWETLQADIRVPLLYLEGGVADVSTRARAVSELAAATISVNGIDIKREELTDKQNALRVEELYQKYLKLPTALLDKLQTEYINLSKEQLDFYAKPEKMSEGIENF